MPNGYQGVPAGRCLIAAGVVETHVVLELYTAAVVKAEPVLCRLLASTPELTNRIRGRGRERGAELAKLSRRASQLATELEHDDIADFVIDTDRRDAGEVAQVVLGEWSFA